MTVEKYDNYLRIRKEMNYAEQSSCISKEFH